MSSELSANKNVEFCPFSDLFCFSVREDEPKSEQDNVLKM